MATAEELRDSYLDVEAAIINAADTLDADLDQEEAEFIADAVVEVLVDLLTVP